MADDAVVAQKGPYQVELSEGKPYFYCRCGRSKDQPFCDGSHKDTGIEPLRFSWITPARSTSAAARRRTTSRFATAPISCSEAAREPAAKGRGGDMEYFVQQLINGLTLGSIYGLIAIGYTMVFGIIGMVNFAHGDVFMVSAFIALILFLLLTQVLGVFAIGLALLIVLVLGMALTALWSWVIERVAYRPLAGSFRLAPLISAIGMSIFLSNLVQVVQGPRNKPVPPMLNKVISLPIGGGNVTLSMKQILIFVLTARSARRLLGGRAEDAAGARPACVRAGPQDGGAARHRRQPDGVDDVRHRRRARRRRRPHVHDLLRRRHLHRRLHAGHQGVHRRRARRHRIAARRRARRAFSSVSSRPCGRPTSPSTTRTSRPSPFSPSR